jgi:uncharacterized protein (TIGR02246 family)
MSSANDIRAGIEAGNRDFIAAFERGDAAAIAKLYTAEGQLLPANSDFVRGSDAIRKFWQGAIDMGLKAVVLDTIEVEDYGDTAIEMGRYRLLAAAGVVADNGKYVVIWKNENGRWRLHRDIWTTNQAPSAV